jgi:L-seryl-tRNA(Ser) seleniumtransferase
VGIYEELGVKHVINCVSTTTPLGSSVTYPAVMDAMNDASRYFVSMNELEAQAGRVVAEITGAEAALITSGCYAALVMATAACMMRGTPQASCRPAMDRPSAQGQSEWLTLNQSLPDGAANFRDQVVIQRCHYNVYSKAHNMAGARIVCVGDDTGCTRAELEGAISEKTAAIVFVGTFSHRGLSFDQVVRLATARGVPIIVDASYTIPPRRNLRKWVAEGATLVCHSGGKSIRGPTDTGFLVGRRDLVNLAAVQMSPHHGVGRGMKVDKTQIVGLLTALRIYVAQDDDEEFEKRDVKCRYLLNELQAVPNIKTVSRVVPTEGVLRGWPVCVVTLDEDALGMTAKTVVDKLYAGDPGVWTYHDHPLCPGGITMNTQNLLDGDELTVVQRFREILSERSQ